MRILDTHSRSTWLVTAVLVAFVILTGSMAHRASAQQGQTTSPARKGRCCYCIAPNKGQPNALDFMEYCRTCLMDPNANSEVKGCDLRESVQAKDFEGADPRFCSSDVLVYNIEHGPIPGKVFDRIRVCEKSVPSCNLDFRDVSCRTFMNQSEADKYIKELQAKMGADSKVTVCGSRSTTYQKGCGKYEAAFVSYVVTKSQVETKPAPCPKEFTRCNPGGFDHLCIDAANQTVKQVCCRERVKDGGTEHSSDVGIWGTPGRGCAASKACPPGCGNEMRCSPEKDAVLIKECVKMEGGDFACRVDVDECKTLGLMCKEFRGKVFCDEPKGGSGRPGRTSSLENETGGLQFQSKASAEFVEAPSGDDFQVSVRWLSVAGVPSSLFGESRVSVVTGSDSQAGLLLESVDPASTLSVLRFQRGDVIHYVNDSPIRSKGDLLRNLAPVPGVLGITYSRGTLRALVRLTVSERGAVPSSTAR